MSPDATTTQTAAAAPDQKTLGRARGNEIGVVVVAFVPDVGELDTSGLADGLIEEAGKSIVELWVDVGFVDERQLCCRRDPENGVSGFTTITSTATPEEHATALRKRLENAVLQRPDDAVVAVQNHVAASEPIHKSSHNSSPSVGAPSGAVCDNPNPTDGELNPGAVSSPNGAAPDPTQTTVQE